MTRQRAAPVYLNLFRIHFPVGAVTSIAHRISGVLLFLSMPLLVYLLDLSLQDADGFRRAAAIITSGWLQALSVPLAWSLLHHLLSGIRFLLLDMETGISLPVARASAWLVNSAAILLTACYAGWLI